MASRSVAWPTRSRNHQGGRAWGAFKRPVLGFWKVHRTKQRIAKTLKVRVKGVDHQGSPYCQTAHTVDISQGGARLDGLGVLVAPGDILEVKRGWRKARFRVVRTGQFGTPESRQVGLCSLEGDKNIWAVRLPDVPAKVRFGRRRIDVMGRTGPPVPRDCDPEY